MTQASIKKHGVLYEKQLIYLGANDWDLLTILSKKTRASILLYIF